MSKTAWEVRGMLTYSRSHLDATLLLIPCRFLPLWGKVRVRVVTACARPPAPSPWPSPTREGGPIAVRQARTHASEIRSRFTYPTYSSDQSPTEFKALDDMRKRKTDAASLQVRTPLALFIPSQGENS
jgi:hypothetical protein